MIKTMISTIIEACTDKEIYNPFVGGCTVVAEIICVKENLLDFENWAVRRRKRPWKEIVIKEWDEK